MHGLQLRHLSFIGPNKEPAVITFGPGLNILYGASDTGKSFIVDAIDFMLGGKGPLEDIEERVGYDQILLGIETLEKQEFTLRRSVDGGAFHWFEGLHVESIPLEGGNDLGDKHNERREDNLSSFLLAKLDLSSKRVRKNARGETVSLSMRNLARLVVVNEEEIIQKRSPLSDGNVVADTANASVFKLLLTGVDDSALAAVSERSPEEQSRAGQMELLDQLISDYQKKVKELAGKPSELNDQLGRLDQSIADQTGLLAASESEYKDVAARRRELLKKVEDGRNRLSEISNLLSRFDLLAAHYQSDISRLQAMEESGNLFAALGQSDCPLCGASPEHHRSAENCEGDIETVVAAARAEISKIEISQGELKSTIALLQREASSFARRLPQLEEELGTVSQSVQQILAPNLRTLRASFSELSDKRSSVREALGMHKTLVDLEERRTALDKEDKAEATSLSRAGELPSSTADKFSTVTLDILKAWHFPNADRVHFDQSARDIVINGKPRTAFGKGLRAITQAAFTVALLQYCRQNGTPHPGFVVLDSPLLSYRKPDNAEDDLRETDLNFCFYDYLAKAALDRQFLIFENDDPPAEFQTLPNAKEFTRSFSKGRYGFFPKVDESSADSG